MNNRKIGFSSALVSGLEVIKPEFILRLKIKRNDFLLADMFASSQSLPFILKPGSLFFLQLSLASSEVPNEIEKAINDAEESRRKVEELGSRKERLEDDMTDHVHSLQSLVDEGSKLTREVDDLEKFSKYLSYIIQVDQLR